MKQSVIYQDLADLKRHIIPLTPYDVLSPTLEAINFLQEQRLHYLKESIKRAIGSPVEKPVQRAMAISRRVYAIQTQNTQFNFSEVLANEFAELITAEGIFATNFVCEKHILPNFSKNKSTTIDHDYDLILRFDVK